MIILFKHNTHLTIILLGDKNKLYIYMHYKTDFYETSEFIDKGLYYKYEEQLIEHMYTCFGYNFSSDGLYNMITRQTYILIVYDPKNNNEKIVGVVYIENEHIKYFDPKKQPNYQKDPTYVDTYILKNAYKNNLIFFESDTDIQNKILFPTISGFCRTPGDKHKGLGTFMLNKIIKILKKKGFNKIYTVPESTHGLTDKNKHDSLCGIGKYGYGNIDNDYYRANMKLIKHYKNVGFSILKNHYIIDVCNMSTNKKQGDYVVINIMERNI